MSRVSRPLFVPAALALLGSLGFPGPSSVSAQEFQGLVSACAETVPALLGSCHRAALTMETARSGLAAAAAGGNPVPGSASTVGYRLRSVPRFAFSLQGSVSRVAMVRLPLADDAGSSPPQERFVIPTLQFLGTLGVFNGFSPAPTVGGLLSVDLTASAQALFLPGNRGFQDDPWVWGMGARVGIIRESFTLPGISLSATRRWGGSIRQGAPIVSGVGSARYDLNVTSLRGTVGKDVLGVGLLAGAGWDRISGRGSISVVDSPSGALASGGKADPTQKRVVFFGGASMTYLILQVSGEAGWSRALDAELPLLPGGDAYPSSGAYFASIAFRLTF